MSGYELGQKCSLLQETLRVQLSWCVCAIYPFGGSIGDIKSELAGYCANKFNVQRRGSTRLGQCASQITDTHLYYSTLAVMSLNILMRTAGYLRPAERVYIRLFVIHAYLDFSLSSHTKCTKALSRYLVEISSGRPESDNFQTFYIIFLCVYVSQRSSRRAVCA